MMFQVNWRAIQVNLGTWIDGLRVEITGFIDASGVMNISNFWVVPYREKARCA